MISTRKIIFNYKICDKAAECGAIPECPTGAITFDKVNQKPVWDESKCTFCLKCTLPDVCPVGAIVFAHDSTQEQAIMNAINSDPHSESWLWLERYGVMPSKVDPIAQLIINKNKDQVLKLAGLKLIDVWHEDFLNCRLHSPLFSDLTKDVPGIKIFKLNAKKHPKLAKNLNISTFPSLLIYNNHILVDTIPSYISEEMIPQLNLKLKSLSINHK